MSDHPTERLATLTHAEPATQATGFTVPKKLAYAVLAVGAAALLVSGLLWQKLANIQEELARRSLDAGAQAIEARTLAKAAQDSTRDLAARLTLQENRISEVSLQRAQLEELMQSLSRSRDENLVVDIESALRLAQQQAQLTGSPVPLLTALASAQQRLQRAAQPRLSPLMRAIAKDSDLIKAASLTDVPALMIKIDELSRMADELPVANGVPHAASVNAAAQSAAVPVKPAEGQGSPAWWGWFDMQYAKTAVRRVLNALHEEGRKLLRVSRIEQPEAALMSPEQSFFLRENLKLRLLNARLGLLARQTDAARADLANAGTWLGKYFDPTSRKTQAAVQLLQQVQNQLKTSELPRLDDTMAALATAAAGR
ncbi:MAG: uroporphyrinogen-III C-methyltransferase [Polaromonas sp.]|jgi:uroporphyrin-3 C-methyltransferase